MYVEESPAIPASLVLHRLAPPRLSRGLGMHIHVDGIGWDSSLVQGQRTNSPLKSPFSSALLST